MSAHENCNYRIGVDTLPTGKVRAKARGRKTNAQTFPEGTAHEAAAEALARKIEGDRFDSVRLKSSGVNRAGHDASDYAAWVTENNA